MKGVILAAGPGEKIAPFNLTRPKAMIPIGNKPIIGHILEALARNGIKDIVVVVGHLAQQIKGYVENMKEQLDLKVTYVYQEKPLGTADALIKASNVIEEDAIIVYGDIVTHHDTYTQIIEKFRKSDAFVVATLAPRDRRSVFSVKTEGDLLTSIKWWGYGDSKVVGIFALSEEAISFVKKNPGIMRNSEIGIMPPLEAELIQSISDMIKQGKAVYGVRAKEYLVDVDFPWDILYANREYYEYLAKSIKETKLGRNAYISDKADIRAPVVLGDNSYIGDRVVVKRPLFVGNNSRIDNGAIISRGIIGNNTIVENYCYVEAILGNNVKVGHAAEVFGVVFDRVYIVHYSEVAGVIGENTDIGAATVVGTLRFDSEEQVVKVKGKRYLVPSVAYIGDYCRTGVNAIIMPGVRIGPYSIVGPGVVLYEDLEPYKMILVKQEYIKREWGPERYGW